MPWQEAIKSKKMQVNSEHNLRASGSLVFPW